VWPHHGNYGFCASGVDCANVWHASSSLHHWASTGCVCANAVGYYSGGAEVYAFVGRGKNSRVDGRNEWRVFGGCRVYWHDVAGVAAAV
ncbi:hypothetical protein LPJ77_006959, partial [Coemansia sp. RSA 2523]